MFISDFIWCTGNVAVFDKTNVYFYFIYRESEKNKDKFPP